jgi:quinoprotein glucose dehydrogenase
MAWNGAPVVAKNVILIGASHRAGTAPDMRNTKGYIRGYDARTGKRLWISAPSRNPVNTATTRGSKSGIHRQHRRVDANTVDENLGTLPADRGTHGITGGHRQATTCS